MGEWSKKIGEFGEDSVEKFLNLIGWDDSRTLKGTEIPCLNDSHLSKTGKNSTTHGIDFLYSYYCPLADEVWKNVLISVKFTADKYPNSPNSVFKGYYNDLANTIECFSSSEVCCQIQQNIEYCNVVDDIGVLFWLSNKDDIDNNDIIAKISSARIDENNRIKAIYVVDNKRVAFISQVISYIRTAFPDYNYDFFYPNTGKNNIASKKINYGKNLPVEFLNSSILPIRVEHKDNNKDIRLLLFSIDSYESDELKKLIGIAKDLTSSWTWKTHICLPDYNDLMHLQEVKIAKNHFKGKFVETVSVLNYNDLNPQIL